MNQKIAKFLRKKSKTFNIPYKTVKRSFEKLDKQQQKQFIQKWGTYG